MQITNSGAFERVNAPMYKGGEEENKKIRKKGSKKEHGPVRAAIEARRDSPWVNLLFSVLVPLVTTVTLEWIARGTLAGNNQGNGFFQALFNHFPSFLLSYILLLTVYVFISQLSGSHLAATILVGLLGNVPAVVTYFKLTLRGEPFLPWDIMQIDDLMGVSDNLSFDIPANIFITAGIFILLSVAAAFVRVPRAEGGKRDWLARFIAAGTALACFLVLMFGIFLSPKGTAAMGIKEDMWMQDRYYRTNGVLTGFLTNLQMLQINQPDGYSAEAAQEIARQVQEMMQGRQPYYDGSYAAAGGTAQTPDIIFLMAESFWDVTALEGIEYDSEILPNLTALMKEGVTGRAYTPSFGGGTCDVEFEALTGFSMEHLPAGSKPYQQYVTEDMFALPQYLKSLGYQTLAIHGYGRRFWNRDTAYPRLGIDEFIASDDFVQPERRRGFISDNAMVDRIIEEYEARQDDGPMFIHAITMQNHTTYNRDRYPADYLVKVTESPDGIPDNTIGQLEDCATGIRDMDAALGKLVDYLRTTERPTILVFWGDHMNPMSDGYSLFEETGFIEKGETASPKLHETPLLFWSNFDSSAVDVGTIATYNIAPVMMELYGMEKPLLFEFLMQQMDAMHGRTRGITIETDSSFGYEMNEAQQAAFDKHALLQYDYMFGQKTQESYLPATG